MLSEREVDRSEPRSPERQRGGLLRLLGGEPLRRMRREVKMQPLERYRVETFRSVEKADPYHVRFDVKPCPECKQIHVPAELLLRLVATANRSGIRIEQPIVIGSCERNR